jgi:CRISPR-associated protein Cmr1
MRKPKISEVPPIEPTPGDHITQTREYELITPLFGGGVVPGESDPVTIIRGTEIRGHLRFWWRACRAGQYNDDLKTIRAVEDHLWGAASTQKKPRPSQVDIAVKIVSEGKADSPFEVVRSKRGKPQVRPRGGSIVPAYAAFPLQPSQDEAKIGMQTKAVRVGIVFTLTISFPTDQHEEVEAALWAWETFGGIGARTRRGFGALQCMRINNQDVLRPQCSQVEQRIKEELDKYIAEGNWPDDVPHLSQAMGTDLKIVSDGGSPIAAWQNLIKKLQAFRQARDGRYGPSLWPEANAIRSLLQDRVAGERPLVEKFPRARFGLPIIFHFSHSGEPADTTLTGVDQIERLASPLILRPAACADGAVGVALILRTPLEPPGGLRLEEKESKKFHPVDGSLDPKDAEQIPPLKDNIDVLRAFLNTL